jgi:hypothetical protein
MATRKLFAATARYLNSGNDGDGDNDRTTDVSQPLSSSKSIANATHKIDLKLLKDAQIRENAQRRKSRAVLEVNKRFLNSTVVNALQGNRYRDSNAMHRAKKKREELEERRLSGSSSKTRMKTPGTNKRWREEGEERRCASSSSSSSSSGEESDGTETESEDDGIEDKIQKLLLLSKSKRGRGLFGARMDDVVETPTTSAGRRDDKDEEKRILKKALASLEREAKKNKRRKKEKKEKKKKKKKKSKRKDQK